MVTDKLFHHSLVKRLQRIPKRVYLIAALCLFAIVYVMLFVVPRQVHFSYATTSTCIRQLTLFPHLWNMDTSDHFAVTTQDSLRVGSLLLASSQTCITPKKTLQPGAYSIAKSPLGGWLLRHSFLIDVPPAPAVSTSSLDKPIPVAKPLIIKLSQSDVLHKYELVTNGRTASCNAAEFALSCDIPSLGLQQGKEYDIKLLRKFAGSFATVVSKKIQTLTSTTVLEGSVRQGETVYARPQEFHFTTDKRLKKARVEIEKIGAGKIESVTLVDGDHITTKVNKELDRGTEYKVTISSIEAIDGSSLAEPYAVTFRMSGGPSVTGVNVDKYGADTSARIVITFDQELSPTQNLNGLAMFSGGSATIARSGAQIVYQLNSLPPCTTFTMTIGKGVLSKFDISSNESWTYSSRTVCYTTSVYGRSLQGRPLLAYYFGSGSQTTVYVGAIHGNESSSSGLMKSWIDHLEANPNLYEGKRIVIIPTINPDGIARGSRTNSRGVNLNRNFPTSNWIADINDTDGRHAGGGGTSPLSEPEASALAAITTSLRPRLLLSFHAVGSLVVGDPGGYSAGYASQYASIVGYKDATGRGGTFEYDITGAYEDWAYVNQGIPSIVIELGSYGYYNFSHHRSALEAMLR